METSFTHARTPNVAREPAEGATAFGLFVLLNAVLFVRPAEIFISLEGLPLYELLILTCLMATMPRLWQGLSLQRLRAQPITGCVIGLLFAVAMSHLSHFDLYGARLCTMQFLKIVAYFFLLVTVIDSAPRFRLFCLFLVAFIGIATLLALLQYHGFVHIASLEAIQENDYDAANDSLNSFYRLCSTGIFNDPNDLSLILVVGIALAT
ncbi:MAG TPA: hypothetical protein VK797_24205, partial [Tepidisphaeraceae bacterium]|nr:hypothetical protein [Tepidisphaeraceae bacterium]